MQSAQVRFRPAGGAQSILSAQSRDARRCAEPGEAGRPQDRFQGVVWISVAKMPTIIDNNK